MKGPTIPLQKGVAHKEEQNVKSSLSASRTVNVPLSHLSASSVTSMGLYPRVGDTYGTDKRSKQLKTVRKESRNSSKPL